MRAVVLEEHGGPEVLRVRDDVPEPVPGPDEVLVRVRATSVNRADLLQRQGLYPAPGNAEHEIPGLEFAGEVLGGSGWPVGAPVMGLVTAGGYAEQLVVPAGQVMPVPGGWSFTDAAAVPEVFLTAFDALRFRLAVAEGDSVLWHAVGSGVGTAGVQLSRYLGLSPILGTSRTPEKLERAESYGLEVGIDSSEGTWAEAVKRATQGRGVDRVIDVLGGGPALGENLRSCARDARIVVLGLMAGRKGELDAGLLLMKRITLLGSTLRARTPAEKAELVDAFQEECGGGLEGGRLRPVVDSVMPLDEVRAAHERVAADETFGKVVLEV